MYQSILYSQAPPHYRITISLRCTLGPPSDLDVLEVLLLSGLALVRGESACNAHARQSGSALARAVGVVIGGATVGGRGNVLKTLYKSR